MHPAVKADILAVLEKTKQSIAAHDPNQLAALSNTTIHDASVFQDEDSLSIAVLVYALGKLLSRGSLDEEFLDSVEGETLKRLTRARELLVLDKVDSYRAEVRCIADGVSRLDKRLAVYVHEVITQAQIKKGGKLYDHGISLARAAQMLGVSQWELMGYVGQTNIVDRTERTKRVKGRIDFARQLFA